ncbi:MAG: histidine phosphatase family protein [Rhizobiaceae bacterium]
MKTPLIWFSRHGETDWNAEGRVQGQFDRDINALGQSQADANGLKLKGLIGDPSQFDFVASPLKRTRETMERIRIGMGLPVEEYLLDDRLMEVHFGDWQGHTLAEIAEVNPELIEARHRNKWHFIPPGADAESYEMLARRFEGWLETVQVPTVCVTHGGVIRSVFYLIEGINGEEASRMPVPQDKVLRLENGKLEWL